MNQSRPLPCGPGQTARETGTAGERMGSAGDRCAWPNGLISPLPSGEQPSPTPQWAPRSLRWSGEPVQRWEKLTCAWGPGHGPP